MSNFTPQKISIMKKFITAFATFLLSAISIIAADSDSTTLLMSRSPIVQDDIPIGRRTPPRRIVCTINFNDYTINGIDESILTYEIWESENEICLASFVDGQEFVSHFLCSNGNFMIKFTTESYTYIGYVETNLNN